MCYSLIMSTLAKKIRDDKCPVITYEVIPPASGADEKAAYAYAKTACELVFSSSVRIDAFNVPEIRSEKREGNRTYQFFSKIDPREFGRELQTFIHGDVEVIVNHSTVYEPVADQLQWLEEASTIHWSNW